jgi:hypothetical protein
VTQPSSPLLHRLVRGHTVAPGAPWIAPSDWLYLLALYAMSRLLVFGVMALAYQMPFEVPAAHFGEFACRWDCSWYVEIAVKGYDPQAWRWDNGDGANWAFFPLVPLAIRGMMVLTGLSGHAAGFVVTNALYLMTLLLVYIYARDLYGRAFGRHAAMLYAVWPFAVHASVPMSEAAYAPLLLAVLILARRGLWWGVAVAAAALSATRAPGMFAVIPATLIAWRQVGLVRLLTLRPGTETRVLALACFGVGIGAYMIYMHGLTGDALAFTHVQAAWNRSFKNPLWTLMDELNPLIAEQFYILYNLFNLGVATLALVLAWRLIRLRLLPEALIVVITIFLGLTTGQTTSLPRFMGAVTPLVVAVAAVTLSRRWRWPAIGGAALASAMITYLWTQQSTFAM